MQQMLQIHSCLHIFFVIAKINVEIGRKKQQFWIETEDCCARMYSGNEQEVTENFFNGQGCAGCQ